MAVEMFCVSISANTTYLRYVRYVRHATPPHAKSKNCDFKSIAKIAFAVQCYQCNLGFTVFAFFALPFLALCSFANPDLRLEDRSVFALHLRHFSGAIYMYFSGALHILA